MKEIKLNLTEEQCSLLQSALVARMREISEDYDYHLSENDFYDDLIFQVFRQTDNPKIYKPWIMEV